MSSIEDKQSPEQPAAKPIEARDLLEIVESAMTEFNEAMRKREELSIRIGRRTTQIMRVGAVTVSLLSLAVIYLTMALKDDMSKMSLQMEQITGLMQTMSTSIQSVPVMADSVQGLNHHVKNMNTLMYGMSESIKAVPVMSTAVQRMSADMTAMNNQIHFLNRNVGGMRHNVDRMASPMKLMPFP